MKTGYGIIGAVSAAIVAGLAYRYRKSIEYKAGEVMSGNASVNFSWNELGNPPEGSARDAMQSLVDNVLQPARDIIGPIGVNSGYRSAEKNASIGGASNSQHVKGEAADIECEDNDALFAVLETLPHDQLIAYGSADGMGPFSFIHVSYKASGNRGEAMYTPSTGGSDGPYYRYA